MIRQITAIGFLLIIASVAAAKERNLDRWVDVDLVPFVSAQLVEHPRFKGETVMFVVLENGAPAAVSNALAISLRDRLLDAALNTAGVSIGRRQGGAPAGRGTQPVDCTHDDVHYYIGIEISQRIDGTYAVSVRALDLEDRNWVTGFGRSWHGQLSSVQRNALHRSETDPTFRGARDVPFAADQADLLAAHLAHELSCALFRETSGRYVIDAAGTGASTDALAATVELVGNNLASHDALELTDDESRVNARLSGKAHRIDGALFQYWLTVTPDNPEDELSTLSTSAYVLLPGIMLAEQEPTEPVPDRAVARVPGESANKTLGPLRLVRSNDTRICNSVAGTSVTRAAYRSYRQDCSLLASDLRSDAIIFVLENQGSQGLVRLAGAECGERTSPHVATRGRPMRWPTSVRWSRRPTPTSSSCPTSARRSPN